MGSVVEINPFTRVEGHGNAKVYFDGTKVERVELSFTESPRLFEALLLGKSYAEVPEIICRICAICSTIHKITALEAVEQAFGVEVPEGTQLTRELIANGGNIQSHALHLFCLALPDLFQVGGVAGLAQKAPELLKRGMNVKRVGNLVQEVVGGRLIHPVNIKLGGLGQLVPRAELTRLKDELEAILPTCRESVNLFSSPSPLPQLPAPLCLAVAPAARPLGGATFLMTGGSSFPVGGYRDQIVEKVSGQSHAKFATVQDQPLTVGALARLTLGFGAAPDAPGEFAAVKEQIAGRDIRGNNVAQAVELCQMVERSLEIIDQLAALGSDGGGNVEVKPREGHGVSATEAPRGVLIHGYSFNESGFCTSADVLTPTSLNQSAMERDLFALARTMEGADPAQLQGALEWLVRCYDPCISCSVHLLRL
jgi:sulfhydrogenase subunit alpha